MIILRWAILGLGCALASCLLAGCGERNSTALQEPLRPGRGYAYTAVLMAAHPQYRALARLDLAASQLDQDEIAPAPEMMTHSLTPLALTETLAYGADPARLAQWRQWWETRYTNVDELADHELPRDLWAGLEWEREQARKRVAERMATADMELSRRLAKLRSSLVRQMQERLNNPETGTTGRDNDTLDAATRQQQRIWESINHQVEMERQAGERDLVQMRAQLEAEADAKIAKLQSEAEDTARARAEQVAKAGETLHSEMAGELDATQWENPAAAELTFDPSAANLKLASGADALAQARANRRDVLEQQRMQVRAAGARLRGKLKRETEIWALAVARRNDIELQLLPGGQAEGSDMTDAIGAELERVWRRERD